MKTLKKVARIGIQVMVSASLISGGIIMTQVTGLNPFGAALTFTGFCLAFPMEEAESIDEYNEAVRAHFSERGQAVPRWALKGGAK